MSTGTDWKDVLLKTRVTAAWDARLRRGSRPVGRGGGGGGAARSGGGSASGAGGGNGGGGGGSGGGRGATA